MPEPYDGEGKRTSRRSADSRLAATDSRFTTGPPFDLPISEGELLDFPADPIQCMRRLHRRHGEIAALQEGRQRLIFVFSPRYNQQVLSDTQAYHARFFSLRGPRNSAQRRLTCGLLSMNGDDHKRHRRLLISLFQKSAIVRYRDGLANLAEQMVSRWRPGQVLDLDREMNRYLLRVTSGLLFGFDRPELAYAIGRKTERWVRLNHDLGMGAFVAEPAITAEYGRLLEEAVELEKLIRQMIALRRSSPVPSTDVLSLLLHARDEDGAGMTEDELIGQAAVLFGAAHLTTAHSLTWTLFLLAQHPRIAADLVRELSGLLHGAPPTVEQLEQLPLLDRVIKESMRVLPASSYSQRITARPVELGPFRLPANVPVIFSQFITHHLPELFPEPERFLPDRWEKLAPPPYGYIPFAAGPRLCLGASMALMTIKTTLPVILQRFSFSVVPGARIDARVLSTMLSPTTGVPIMLHPVSNGVRASPVRGNIHDLVQLPAEALPPLRSLARRGRPSVSPAGR